MQPIGAYVPSMKRECLSNCAGNLKLEAIIAKVLHKVEAKEVGVRDMRGDMTNIHQLGDSYSTLVK